MTIKCPHCGKEITGSPCQECGAVVPDSANYCMECGCSLEERVIDSAESDNQLDLENRVLCADGTCTGIIIKGRCSECGKVSVG